MNIIERTQYSADGGETWHSTEAEARKETAEAKAYLALAEHFMDNVCGSLMFAIRENPDALIAALRDMGALPADGPSEGVIVASLVHDEVFDFNGEEYQVMKVSNLAQHEKQCEATGNREGRKHTLDWVFSGPGEFEHKGRRYAVIPAEQHAKEEAALARVIYHAKNDYCFARDWCDANGINWRHAQ